MDITKNERMERLDLFKTCMFWTFALGLAAHAFSYFNLHFNHDSVEILSPFLGGGSWHVSLGRFFVPIVSHARGILNSPSLIGLLSLIFFGFSVFLIANIFQISNKVCIALISGIFVTNASVTIQNALFMFSMDALAIAFFLSILSVYLIAQRRDILHIVFSIVCFMAALATTGQFLSVWAVLVIILLFFKLAKLQINDYKACFQEFFLYILVAAFASILFLIGTKIACKVTNVSPYTEGYNSFNQAFKWNSISEILVMLKKTYKNFFLRFFIDIPFYSRIVKNLFRVFMGLVFAYSIAVTCIKIQKQKLFAIIVCLVLGLVLPFAAELSYFLTHGGVSYEGTLWPHYIIYIYPILVFHAASKKVFRLIQTVFFLFIFSNIIVANGTHVKTKMIYDSTCSTLNRIIANMEQDDEYTAGETPVVFVGLLSQNKNFQKNIFPKYGLSTEKGASNISVTYINTYAPFMQIVMNNNVNFNPYTREYADFPKMHSDAINAMPKFPSKGCCRMIDGKMVVKLSEVDLPDYLPDYAEKLSLPEYSITDGEVNFCIDNETLSDSYTYLCGWAYHENDICRVIVVAGEHYWETILQARPDVQKAFNLNNDKQGFSATIPAKLDGYSLYLVNDEKKEIYRKKIRLSK